MEYQHQLKAIQTLNIEKGRNYRGDCIFCLNRNTLSVRNENGKLIWNCFHASCEAKGIANNGVTIDDLQTFMDSKDIPHDIPPKFTIPKEFVTVYGNNKAREYISKYELEDTEARLMYDVKQDRIVFLIENNGEVVGAVGRGLADDTIPKWYKYNTCHYPFVAGSNKYIGVVVEDCVSACKVAMANLTGVAIMGTSLKEVHKSHLRPYKNLYICLDRDATTKAYDMAKDLRSSGFDNVIVKPLTDDLKYYNTEQIREIFYDRKTND